MEHEGQFYCKMHHPPTAKAKKDANYEAHYSKWQADRAAAKELARRAACFPELLEALKGLLHEEGGTLGLAPKNPLCVAAKSAITKAENTETR